MDPASLIVALTGVVALAVGTYQSRQGRKDGLRNQQAAELVEGREQTLAELRELAAQRKADAAELRIELAEARREKTAVTAALRDAYDTVELLRRAVHNEVAKSAATGSLARIDSALIESEDT